MLLAELVVKLVIVYIQNKGGAHLQKHQKTAGMFQGEGSAQAPKAPPLPTPLVFKHVACLCCLVSSPVLELESAL